MDSGTYAGYIEKPDRDFSIGFKGLDILMQNKLNTSNCRLPTSFLYASSILSQMQSHAALVIITNSLQYLYSQSCK